jgi:HSP20 family protein
MDRLNDWAKEEIPMASTDLERREGWIPNNIGHTLNEMRDEMNRLFNLGASRNNGKNFSSSRVLWTPPVDIAETNDELTLTIELPGIELKDVTISLENHVLNLHGERKFEQDKKEASYHLVERSYGVFQRTFSLPDNVQVDKISANMKNGVLTLHLPKREESKPRTIEVAVE